MYYSSIGMLSLAIHLIINYEVLKKRQAVSGRKTGERYRHFLYSVTVYYVSDILWGILYGYRLFPFIYIDTVLYFFSMVLSVLLWTRFVVAYLNTRGSFEKVLLYAGWGIFTFELLALIVNLFTPVVFGFGPDNEYEPGRVRYFTLFIQMALFLMTSFYTLVLTRKKDRKERLHYNSIGISGIFMTVFIALQSLFPLLPFYAIGCLLATCIIHSFVYRDEKAEHYQEIGMVRRKAYLDPLTGVKNKLSYIESLRDIEIRMEQGELKEFAVAVFDLNGLKEVNDEKGHDAGDEFIKSACHLICQRFKHSPVFRVGGDEFVAILEGDDYTDREHLIREFDQTAEENQRSGLVVVSSGMDVYIPEKDSSYNDVFRRADRKMYNRKEALKINTSR